VKLYCPARKAGDGKNEGNLIHGWSATATYRVWNGMTQRCCNINAKVYPHYGGRGIKVCDEWMTFLGFLNDMGPRPEGLELDRINNAGNYELSNCRWATREQQLENRRTTIFVVYREKKMSLAAACRMAGVNRHAVYLRITRGWEAQRAIEAPFANGRNK
jgi:hypothetical protein